MGDFVYNGSHAITFIVDNDRKDVSFNTWKTWHMAPKSRPYVESPKVKESYIDVPASDGSLDYTDILTGKAVYANRTGSWEFIIDNGYSQWYDVYTDVLLKLHGKKVDRIILDDDPTYYWKGRLFVTGNFSPRDYNMITISYNLDPYKRLVNSEEVHWWKWRELFDNNIILGPFTVNGVKARNLYNNTGSKITANLNTTYKVTAYPYDGSETMQYAMLANSFEYSPDIYDHIDFFAGDNVIELEPGNNYFFFVGSANVTVDYERGKVL